MTEPRLEACYFDDTPEQRFALMANILAFTAATHCAAWRRSIEAIRPESRHSPLGIPSHVHNTQKLERWAELVTAAPDGDCILLLDADTCILQPIDDLWDDPFDLAYTTKRRPFPFNLGVVAVRVSDPVRTFFDRWRSENAALCREPGQHLVWRQRFGGVNQASFGLLLERGGLAGLAIRTLPCAVWNCEESGWAKFDRRATRILHVKGALRRAIFRREARTPEFEPLVALWRDLDRDAQQMERTA